MLGFPNRIPEPTEQWLLWRRQSGHQTRGLGGEEGYTERELAFQQLVQKRVEQMAAIKCVLLCSVCACMCVCLYACISVHTHT